MSLEVPIFIGGLLHFGTLLASAAVPSVLRWRHALRNLDRLTRQLIWVHGAFLVLVIIAFGVLSTMFSDALSAGTPLARAVCCFISGFWATRLAVQFFLFDARDYLDRILLKLGYHGLTVVFVYQTVVYGLAAWGW